MTTEKETPLPKIIGEVMGTIPVAQEKKETPTPKTVEEVVADFEETWSDFIGDIEFNDAFKHLADDPDVPFVLPQMCKWLRTALTTLLTQAEEEKQRAVTKERVDTLIQVTNWLLERKDVEAAKELNEAMIKHFGITPTITSDKTEVWVMNQS